ncbi:DUF1194 domain-containing protein [Ruegeria sediminis]|uniref:DUF1194 domain-containing protein n=1 Tax=Ruegeria sediminis TaxID=2583820 RepID=A0ABY2X3R7_9RHOB|nr:DUF1194 domain-containing protein [Ruegeria sediminis]TMV09595.1 DUF1194 domain-containing protein [Ruegeria sediminis]
MIRWAASLGLALAAGPSGAAECRLALALAMDVSASVDAAEDALQRGGLASALISPEVERAFFASPLPVALAVYEWSGRSDQSILVDWRLIRTRAELHATADTIARSPRSQTESATAMGHALAFGAQLLQRAPVCLFKTIDVAGDGANNDGYEPRSAYAHFPFDDVVVNGLVINGADFEGELNLIDFYTTEVLRGPGAFLEVAQGFENYHSAMRRKLERELSGAVIGGLDGRVPR